jgi:hypothetical protein
MEDDVRESYDATPVLTEQRDVAQADSAHGLVEPADVPR